jgi:hypothetical protein
MLRLSADEITAQLRQHTGSGLLYRHPMHKRLFYSEGVQFLASACEAYWLLDAICSHQPQAIQDSMLREIQFWTLRQDAHGQWDLTCEADTNVVRIHQHIEYSDFPLTEIKLWVVSAGPGKWTMILPSEY